MRVPVEIIPSGYGGPDLEPIDFGRKTTVMRINGDHWDGTRNENDPIPINQAMFELDEGTIAKLREEAAIAYEKLDEENQRITSPSAIVMQLVQRYVHNSQQAAVLAKASSPAPTQASDMTKRSSIIRQTRPAATINPFEVLGIDGLTATARPADVTTIFNWRNEAKINQLQTHVSEFHWAILVADEHGDPDEVARVILVRDTRTPGEFEAPPLVFHDRLTVDIKLIDGADEMVFSALSGIFRFQFGVFDFCMFLVAKD